MIFPRCSLHLAVVQGPEAHTLPLCDVRVCPAGPGPGQLRQGARAWYPLWAWSNPVLILVSACSHVCFTIVVGCVTWPPIPSIFTVKDTCSISDFDFSPGLHHLLAVFVANYEWLGVLLCICTDGRKCLFLLATLLSVLSDQSRHIYRSTCNIVAVQSTHSMPTLCKSNPSVFVRIQPTS